MNTIQLLKNWIKLVNEQNTNEPKHIHFWIDENFEVIGEQINHKIKGKIIYHSQLEVYEFTVENLYPVSIEVKENE